MRRSKKPVVALALGGAAILIIGSVSTAVDAKLSSVEAKQDPAYLGKALGVTGHEVRVDNVRMAQGFSKAKKNPQ